MSKCALICFGNEESYGIQFVAGELLLYGQEIKYFDTEKNNIVNDIIDWSPDFIMFSPMTVFFENSLDILKKVKQILPNVISVYGGHHASSYSDIIENPLIDVVVVGPVRGSIDQILNGYKGIIKLPLTTPDNLPMPDREHYYNDIPRMKQRYRKVMISLFGCPWNCSYCSSSSNHLRELYGNTEHKKYFLNRRPIDIIMKEAKEIIRLSPETQEIEWVDDDLFSGNNYEEWLLEFIKIWKKEINLPMYVSTTSLGVLKASDNLLTELRSIVNVVGMGIQAIRPESLKMFGRQWDNEKQMKDAYDRLISFGYRVNLQAIVGLPVKDTVDEALDTIKAIQRIGPGCICSIYPLMIYPGTKMEKYYKNNGYMLHYKRKGDTNSGIPDIWFKDLEMKRLKNICKLATMFVKYNIDERWMRILIDIDYNTNVSKDLSMTRYYECIRDRLGSKGEKIFDEIQKSMKLRY